MTFDRPYDRSSIGTNAYAIAPTIAPAIGFNRPFDRLYPIPPHPYARSKRSPRPWVAASAPVAWKGRAERPHCRHVCSNAELTSDDRRIIHARGRRDNRYLRGFEERTGPTLGPAAMTRRSIASNVSGLPGPRHRFDHSGSHVGRDLRARVASASLTLAERKTRPRGHRARRRPARCSYHFVFRSAERGGGAEKRAHFPNASALSLSRPPPKIPAALLEHLRSVCHQ